MMLFPPIVVFVQQHELLYLKSTLCLTLSPVNSACHALLDRFLEGNLPDQMFPHHLRSDDDGQSKTCVLACLESGALIP